MFTIGLDALFKMGLEIKNDRQKAHMEAVLLDIMEKSEDYTSIADAL